MTNSQGAGRKAIKKNERNWPVKHSIRLRKKKAQPEVEDEDVTNNEDR